MPQHAQSLTANDLTEVARHLHTLVQLMQRTPSAQEHGQHAAFFDAVRAVLIDAGRSDEAADVDPEFLDHMAALERRPLGHDPLVFDLLQLLRAYGYLEGARGTRLVAALKRLLGSHLRLFWQTADEPDTLSARSVRTDPVNMNALNLPWHLLPGQRNVSELDAANAPDGFATLRDAPRLADAPPAAS